jgi:hypothetical protein
MVSPVILEPPDLPDNALKREEVIWEASIKSYARRTDELRSNLNTLYAVIWGQCSKAMRTKGQALDEFYNQNLANNCTWLLGEIKWVTHQFNTKQNMFLSLLEARIAFYLCKQGQNQSNADYLEIFTSNIQVLEYYKASISESYLLIDDLDGRRHIPKRIKMARGSTIAIAFLRGADPRWYATVWSDLANQKNRGNDQYPGDLTSAYSMLVNYHVPVQGRFHQSNQSNQGAPLMTSGTTIPSTVLPDVGPHTFAQAA